MVRGAVAFLSNKGSTLENGIMLPCKGVFCSMKHEKNGNAGKDLVMCSIEVWRGIHLANFECDDHLKIEQDGP